MCHLFTIVLAHSPFIPYSQFEFVKGSGAHDCGAALAFTTIQALEHHPECRIVSLDICGAFDSVFVGWITATSLECGNEG